MRHAMKFPGDVNDNKSSEPLRIVDLIPLENVPTLLPGRPDRSTVFRWVTKGCCGARLKTVSVGRTRHTTERWLVEFFTEVAGARDPSHGAAPTQARPRRQRDPRSAVQARTAEILRNHGLSEAG
jgi:Protein of unknown function (DUF1580)